MVISGSGDQALNLAIREHFNPGDKLMLEIALPRTLSYDELVHVGDELAKGIEVHSVRSPSNKLQVSFTNPAKVTGYALFWLPIIGILAALGITGYLTWKVGTIPESISKNIVPITIALIAGGVVIAYVLSKPGAPSVKRLVAG